MLLLKKSNVVKGTLHCVSIKEDFPYSFMETITFKNVKHMIVGKTPIIYYYCTW